MFVSVLVVKQRLFLQRAFHMIQGDRSAGTRFGGRFGQGQGGGHLQAVEGASRIPRSNLDQVRPGFVGQRPNSRQ